MLNAYHKECAEESDEDYSDECESSEHSVSCVSEEEPDEDGPEGNSSADDHCQKWPSSKTLDIMYIINFVKITQIWSAQG